MRTIRIFCIILLIFTGIGALYGGTSLMMDPSGKLMQIPLRLIKNSPFRDYFIPGILLFAVIGIFSLLISAFIMFKGRYHGSLVILQGCFIVIWIIAQILFLNAIFWMQFLFAGIGILLILLGVELRSAHGRTR